jgi:chromosome segregation ATPase
VYRAEALLDQPPEQDTQVLEDVSTVERVKTVLVEREEVLHKAREYLAGARTIAAAWEAEVTSARAQLQQDHVTLEGVQAWQSQAEGLRTTLADKAAALTTAEEQLRQEQAAHQQAETQLQQERAALTDERAALEREHLA